MGVAVSAAIGCLSFRERGACAGMSPRGPACTPRAIGLAAGSAALRSEAGRASAIAWHT